MRLNGILYYAFSLFFLGWCVVVFQADLAKITLTPILTAWDAVLLAGGLSLVNYLLRIMRWSLYLSRLGHSLQFGFSALTYIAGFAFTLSPGKVGEMVRGRYLQKVGVPLSNTAAAFFIERLMDLFAMISLAGLAVGSSHYNALIVSTVVVIVLIMAVLALAPWTRVSVWVHGLTWLPKSLHRVLQSVLQTLLSARALLHPGILVTGFCIGIIAWGCEGIGLMVIGTIASGVSMDVTSAIGIYSVAIIVGALSFLPGGLGSTEAVMVVLLDSQGYPVSDAMLITLVCRLLTLWLAVGIGWLAVFILRPKNIS